MKFSEAFPDSNFVSVLPPSIEELRSRLEKRGTETAEKINTRVGNAQGEMDIIMGKPEVFQFRLTNDNLDEACQVLHNLVGSLYSTELGDAAKDVDEMEIPSGPKPVVFFVLGGPGAGKGTQCAKLV